MRQGALLLDLDGVLFDSEPVHRRAWEACLASQGVSLPCGWYDALRGRSLAAVAEALVERFAAGTAPAELGARKRLAYRALAASLAPSPGVADALAEQRLRAALVSSSSRADVELLVRGSPLEPLLEVVVTGDDVAAPKPAPDGYLLALRRLGVPPAGCVAVEDSRCGVEAAVAAGLRVVAVAALEPPPPGATWWCPTSAEAIRLAGAAVASYSPICFA